MRTGCFSYFCLLIDKNTKIMQTSTLIIILASAVVVLAFIVVFLLWLMHRKDEDLKKKNDVIVREVRRNQTLIDYGVSQGLSRSTMLDMSR